MALSMLVTLALYQSLRICCYLLLYKMLACRFKAAVKYYISAVCTAGSDVKYQDALRPAIWSGYPEAPAVSFPSRNFQAPHLVKSFPNWTAACSQAGLEANLFRKRKAKHRARRLSSACLSVWRPARPISRSPAPVRCRASCTGGICFPPCCLSRGRFDSSPCYTYPQNSASAAVCRQAFLAEAAYGA